MQVKETAIRAAKKTGDILLEFFGKAQKYQAKNDRDILAEADLAAEKAIIEEISKNFPEHSIFSEEEGKIVKQSPYRWVMDPLDGTINFVNGIEEWCIAMALEKDQELIFSLVYQPVLNKLYLAEKGKGAFLNDRQVFVSQEREFLNMLLAFDNSSNHSVQEKNCQIILEVCNKFRSLRLFGSGSLQLARMASAEIDVYFKATGPHYWDYAPGTLLVKEAGGMVTDFQGREITEDFQSILASNGQKHQELLTMFQKFL